MLVVVLPDRDGERAGVIRTIFMNETLIHRPTSGASAEELAAQLLDARSCTRRLTDDLSTQQLMGPMLPIVNPILWEIGHVGWFHEYWTLRHAQREAPILARAGALAGDVDVPGGKWQLGSTPADGFVFDNEKWAHAVEVAPFRIAKAPVTNAEFAAFIAEGGYRRREFWSALGWEWRERARAEHPVYWINNEGDSWTW